MRRHLIGATVALFLAASPAALAEKPPADSAKAACKAEKHGMGTRVFKRSYAAKSTAKAMAACVADPPAADDVPARVNAAEDCKAQRKDDAEAFAAEWGTRRNAFGKCVSATATA